MDGLRTAVKFFSPRWLAEGVAEKILYTVGLAHDALIEALDEGIRSHLPGIGTPTALKYTGKDRQILRGIGESDGAYATRLSLAWTAWRTAGGSRSLLNMLRGYLQLNEPFRTVSNGGDFFTLAKSPTADSDGLYPTPRYRRTWNWDGLARWQRMWIILYSPDGAPWSPEGTWGDGQLWGDGGTWGSTASLEVVQSVRAILKNAQRSVWKAQHAVVPFIIVAFDDTMFDPVAGTTMPDGTWGNWSKTVAGVRVPARNANAIYWDGAT